jgi:SAM-dependent methyltransferase
MEDKETSDYFQSWGDDRFTENQRIYQTVGLVSKAAARGDVLDLGCGSRVYYDTSEVQRWVGLDLSESLLKDIKFLCGSPPKGPVETSIHGCTDLPFEAETFYTVFAMFILHHLGSKNRANSRRAVSEAIGEARRVLNPGGTMMILETWPKKLMHVYHALYPVLYPMALKARGVVLPYFFGPRAMRAMAREAGFSECHVLAVDLYERVHQPVLGFALPAWAQRLFQTYTIYLLRA